MQTTKYRLKILAVLTCSFILIWASGVSAQATNKGDAIWVIDFKEANNTEVVKFNADTGAELFRKGGFELAKSLIADPRDGSIWVVDAGSGQIIKLSSDGLTELARLSGFASPHHGSLSIIDDSFWVADGLHSEVAKVSADGKRELLRISGFNLPHDIEVSLYDNSVWVMDSAAGQVIKLANDGKMLGKVKGLGNLMHFTVSPFDGSCWVVKNPKGLVKISPDGTKILADNPDMAGFELSVNPIDGSCWVADKIDGVLYNIANDGKTQLLKLDTLFKSPVAISVINPLDGSFWVVDSGRREAIKVSGLGKELKKISGFVAPDNIVETR